MKVVVFGRNGWLAQKFADSYNIDVSSVDILNVAELTDFIFRETPDVVINCAGRTGTPNIDWCNANDQNRLNTRTVNSIAPAILQANCKLIGARFVHISSGCIWNGGVDLDESSNPSSPSFYAETKVDGEKVIDKEESLIIRLRMPFDGSGSPRCLISKLIKYPKIISIQNSVTYIPDLVSAVKHLIDNNERGIFNIVNDGTISGRDILERYKNNVDKNHIYEIVDMEYLMHNNLCLDGRSNCTLSNSKLLKAGFRMPDAIERLDQAIENLSKQFETQ